MAFLQWYPLKTLFLKYGNFLSIFLLKQKFTFFQNHPFQTFLVSKTCIKSGVKALAYTSDKNAIFFKAS